MTWSFSSDVEHQGQLDWADAFVRAGVVGTYETASAVVADGLGWFWSLARYKQAAAAALILKHSMTMPSPGVDAPRLQRMCPWLVISAVEHVERHVALR